MAQLVRTRTLSTAVLLSAAYQAGTMSGILPKNNTTIMVSNVALLVGGIWLAFRVR